MYVQLIGGNDISGCFDQGEGKIVEVRELPTRTDPPVISPCQSGGLSSDVINADSVDSFALRKHLHEFLSTRHITPRSPGVPIPHRSQIILVGRGARDAVNRGSCVREAEYSSLMARLEYSAGGHIDELTLPSTPIASDDEGAVNDPESGDDCLYRPVEAVTSIDEAFRRLRAGGVIILRSGVHELSSGIIDADRRDAVVIGDDQMSSSICQSRSSTAQNTLSINASGVVLTVVFSFRTELVQG